MAADLAAREARLKAGPDLHTLGTLFLGPWARFVFDACVMLHFVSILISYALAGSQAYGNVLGVKESEVLIVPFVALFTAIVVFGSQFLRPVISLITLSKGVVLIVMVAVTAGALRALNVPQLAAHARCAVISAAAKVEYVSAWVYIGRPLLIGTVALGGGGNVIPVVLAKVPNTTREIRRNTIALVLGLAAVWLLCVLWSLFILRAVPQHNADGDEGACDYVTTLGRAQSCGKIATIPLIDVVRESIPRFNWIATFVDVFITLSISVSFLTMSLATKHVLDGFASAWGRSHAAVARCTDVGRLCGDRCHSRRDLVRAGALYVLTWTPIAIIAQANPKSFLVVMESVTSLVLNLEAGVFICFMIGAAHHQYADVKIAWPLKRWMYWTHFPVMGYFLFAVVFDILLVLDALIEGKHD